jgi:hypothetical protein
MRLLVVAVNYPVHEGKSAPESARDVVVSLDRHHKRDVRSDCDSDYQSAARSPPSPDGKRLIPNLRKGIASCQA